MQPGHAGESAQQGHPYTVAVVLCAGQGTRMSASRNKVFLPLAGRPLVVHTLRAFEAAASIDEALLVAHASETEYVEREILGRYPLSKVTGVVAGGATRHQSEQNALDALRERIARGEIDVILVHDGARPFVTPDAIDRLVAAAHASGAAILAAPIAADEVLLGVDEDGRLKTLNSSSDAEGRTPYQLMRAQTPQGFSASALLAAYDQARADAFEGTDTAAALERLGMPVMAVASTAANLKITTPDDLLRAEALLRAGSHEEDTD